jgi:hypothetical protein
MAGHALGIMKQLFDAVSQHHTLPLVPPEHLF